ncbi:MAG TPA: hypothetical protein VFB62_11100, partial [Polyangiaceae bacterium]|nr:hypothetical protein [Polyangiaceae bacterium]
MRPKVTFIVLILMLVAVGVGVFFRRGSSQASAPVVPNASASAPTASASAVASAPAPKSKGPQLGRALRVAGLGWELLAPAVMANDGATAGKDSRFKKAGLDVELSANSEVTQVENALARGGEDEKGADVAVLPLQRFVASYERLKALNPVIFFVVGWSDGGEIIQSKKASFDELPAQGDVKLRATAGEPAAFLGLYAFDLAGVAADRIKLVSDGEVDWSAITRREARQRSEQTSGNLLLSTSEASQLVPFVAITQASLLSKNPDALVALAEGWLGGHELLAQNPTAASRKIGDVKGAPEPLAVLARLGEIRAASLSENAELAGLAGRGAVTLEALFHRTWQIWRNAKVLSIPPEQAPIDGTIIATLVRSGGKLTAAPSPPRK